MSGGSWFVLATVALQVGAAAFYAVKLAWPDAIMYLCIAAANAAWVWKVR